MLVKQVSGVVPKMEKAWLDKLFISAGARGPCGNIICGRKRARSDVQMGALHLQLTHG